MADEKDKDFDLRDIEFSFGFDNIGTSVIRNRAMLEVILMTQAELLSDNSEKDADEIYSGLIETVNEQLVKILKEDDSIEIIEKD